MEVLPWTTKAAPPLTLTAVAPSELPTLPSTRVPLLIVVAPVYVFAPERSSVPLPTFCRASAPALFWIVPPNVLVALLLPTVKVGVPPARVSIVPLPERLPTAAL